MGNNILQLTGQGDSFLEGRKLFFPTGYLVDSEGTNWEIVNPNAGLHQVIIQEVGGRHGTRTVNITEDEFEKFVPTTSLEGITRLLKERFNR
ncbi:MAG: hypothetical protein WA152_02995 [Microgenomates group bacterium]